jgi:cyanophycin synthetase
VAPSEGTPRDVAGPVMDMLFPEGSPSRIPIAAVTGTNGKTTTVRMLAHILKLTGRTVGMTTTDGVYIDGELTVEGDMTGPLAARMVLRDPKVDTAVLETARGGLLRAGLGYRHSNVAACMNVQSDHLGLRGIETLDQLAAVKRTVVEVARDTAVLNADDPLCLKMADYTEAEYVCYVTIDPDHELVRQHVRAGGRAVVLEHGMNGYMITLYASGAHMPLLWTHLIPATMEGRALFNVQNAMFAAALAYSMGISLDDIRHGLRTFDTTFFQAPGRMNVYAEHPFKVILDYGHNASAVQALVDLVKGLDVEGRRIVVVSAPGDRRDDDIRGIARIVAGGFDHYICRRDDNLRGRESDEVPLMVREELLAAGADSSAIEVIPDEQTAVNAALSRAEPGDLVLIFGDQLARTWGQITGFSSDGRPASEPNVPVAITEPVRLPGRTAFELDVGQRLIRDERGVRLAREEAD